MLVSYQLVFKELLRNVNTAIPGIRQLRPGL